MCRLDVMSDMIRCSLVAASGKIPCNLAAVSIYICLCKVRISTQVCFYVLSGGASKSKYLRLLYNTSTNIPNLQGCQITYSEGIARGKKKAHDMINEPRRASYSGYSAWVGIPRRPRRIGNVDDLDGYLLAFDTFKASVSLRVWENRSRARRRIQSNPACRRAFTLRRNYFSPSHTLTWVFKGNII
ncbi:hypothetical protein BCR34DRAFT_201227 [Clohesyomyces aquaticus]|uniref:Uncharacterized protein n=1 Tax=Clohesyomyces aquaticus TaxID=1231657 RepID=A0A1Y1ZYM7_9PLEO|nr:hypothetical protein BCR34DRAFT_201227 [Clohesyomyces aquaticus]